MRRMRETEDKKDERNRTIFGDGKFQNEKKVEGEGRPGIALY